MASEDTIGKLIVRLLLDDSQFQDEKKKATKGLFDLGGMFDKVAAGIERGFVRAIQGGTVATAAFAAASTVMGAGFEKQMQRVAAISGIVDRNSDAYIAMEQTARKIGATTAFTATEAAQGMEILAQAGLSLRDTLDASGAAVKFAGSNAVSMESSVNLLAATLTQFKLSGDQATRVVDVFNEAARSSLFDVNSLTEAMKYAGTVGAGLGMSLEETTAAVAQFRNLGLEGSLAGTSFRMTMASLAKPTKDAQEALTKYGITVADVNPEMHSFRDIMLKIGKAGITTADAIDIFGLRAGTNARQIANAMAQSSTQYDQMLENLRGSAGVTDEMYATMMDSVWGSFKTLTSNLEEGFLRLFDTFRAPLSSFLAATIGMVDKINDAIRDNAGDINRRFVALFSGLTTWVNNNSDMIAGMAVSWVKLVLDVLEAAQALLPVLTMILGNVDNIAIAAASLWAGLKTMAIARWIAGITAQLVAAESATAAIVTTVKLATGGWIGLAAGAAVALGGMAFAMYRASEASQDLSAQMKKGQAVVLKEVKADQDKYTASLSASVEQAKKATLEMALQAESAGKLSAAVRQLREDLERLPLDNLAGKVVAGDLLLVKGQLESIDQIMREKTPEGMKALSDHMVQIGADSAKARARLDELTTTLRELQQGISPALAKAKGGIETALPYVLNGQYSTIAELQGAVEAAKANLATTSATVTAYADRLRGLQAKMDGEAAAAATAAAEAAQQRAESASKETLKAREDADKALLALTQQTQADMAAIYGTGAERVQREMEEQKSSIDKTYAELKRNYVGNRAGLLALDREQQDALFEAFKRVSADGYIGLETEFSKAQELINRTYDEARKAYAGNAEKLQALEEQRQGSLMDAQLVYVLKRQQLDVDITEKRQAMIKAELDERADAYTKEAEQDRARMAQEEADLNDWMDKQVAAQKNLDDRLRGLEGKRGSEAARLRAERDQLLHEMANQGIDGAENVARVQKVYREKIWKAMVSEAVTAVKKVTSVVSGVVKFVTQDVVRFVSGTVSTVLGTFNKISDAMGKLTGMPLDIRGGISSVTSTVEDQRQSKLDAGGKWTQGDMVKASKAAADAFGADMADKAIRTVQIMAAAMPALIDKLVEEVPRVITNAVQQIPRVVQALVDGIPVLLGKIAEALPRVVMMLVEAAQKIVTAIVNMLPQMVDSLIAVLPFVVRSLLDMVLQLVDALILEIPKIVVAVVEMIPMLVRKILAALPEIITGLLAGIGTIIQALLEALPKIVKGILNALPEIILALITGIVGMVGTLIKAVIEFIPELIRGILTSLPTLLTTLINGLLKAIPSLLDSLIDGLPELISQLIGFFLKELPMLVISFIGQIVASLPEIIVQLWDLIFLRFPELLLKIITGIVEGIGSIFGGAKDKSARDINKDNKISGSEKIANTLWDLFNFTTLGVARLGVQASKHQLPNQDEDGDGIKNKDDPDFIPPADRKGVDGTTGNNPDGTGGKKGGGSSGSHYSGIEYIPRRMRVTVHEGEAIMPASRNPMSERFGANPPNAGGGGGRGSWSGTRGGAQVIQVVMDGRVVQESLVTADQRGQGGYVSKVARRAAAAGGTVGVDAGPFNKLTSG